MVASPVTNFRFYPTTGENLELDFATIRPIAHRSRAGRLVLTLPDPYEDIQLVNGERIGPAKLAKLKAAIEALGGHVVSRDSA
jgi:hypothetical protein